MLLAAAIPVISSPDRLSKNCARAVQTFEGALRAAGHSAGASGSAGFSSNLMHGAINIIMTVSVEAGYGGEKKKGVG